VRPELYDRVNDAGEERDVARSHPTEVARLEAELAARESVFTRRATERAALDDDTRRRLEALGYVVSGGGTEPPVHGLKDIKTMLSVKHLDGRFGRAYHAGRVKGDRAVTIARKLVRHSPESPPFRQNLGTLLADQGQTSEAVEQLREALRLDPERGDVKARLDELLRASQ
jgi:predicted Zn-dependent protease